MMWIVRALGVLLMMAAVAKAQQRLRGPPAHANAPDNPYARPRSAYALYSRPRGGAYVYRDPVTGAVKGGEDMKRFVQGEYAGWGGTIRVDHDRAIRIKGRRPVKREGLSGFRGGMAGANPSATWDLPPALAVGLGLPGLEYQDNGHHLVDSEFYGYGGRYEKGLQRHRGFRVAPPVP